MTKEEMRRLHHRRQYLITPHTIECPFLHNVFTLPNKFLLYAHIDLKITEIKNKKKRLILMGDIFDYEDTRKDNNELIKDLIEYEFPDFLERI